MVVSVGPGLNRSERRFSPPVCRGHKLRQRFRPATPLSVMTPALRFSVVKVGV